MTLSWIRLDVSLPRHPKAYALDHALGVERSWTFVVELWLWAAITCPDGDLSSTPDTVIARCAGWHDDASRFVSALTASGFLDSDRRLHNWHSRQLKRVEKAERDALTRPFRRAAQREERPVTGPPAVTARSPATDRALRTDETDETDRTNETPRQGGAAPPPKIGRIGGWQIDKPRTADELLATAVGQKVAKRYPMLDGRPGRPAIAEIVGTIMSWDSYGRWQWPHGVENNLMTYVGREAQKHRIAWEREQNPNQQPGRADPRQTVTSNAAEKTRQYLAEKQRLMDETHGEKP